MYSGTASSVTMSEHRNIYIIGAQSTGKTTLVTALADYFEHQDSASANLISKPKVLKEIARSVLKQHNFTASDIVTSKAKALRLQQLILEAQAQAEASLGDSWYISDRSGLDALAYTLRYVGEKEEKEMRKSVDWQDVEQRMKNGLVVLCEAGCEWLVDDGIRLMPKDKEDWIQMHRLFCGLLDEVGLKYVVLPTGVQSVESRVEFVVRQWEMHEPPHV